MDEVDGIRLAGQKKASFRAQTIEEGGRCVRATREADVDEIIWKTGGRDPFLGKVLLHPCRSLIRQASKGDGKRNVVQRGKKQREEAKPEEKIVWESDNLDVAQITEDGNFTLVNTGSCTFTGRMVNKNTVTTTINVIVEESLPDSYVTVLTPTTDYIRLNQTEHYSVYEYNNYNITDTKFDIKCYDIPQRNYKFNTDGNNFEITNLKTCDDILLRVVYTNLRTQESKTLYVELGGIM